MSTTACKACKGQVQLPASIEGCLMDVYKQPYMLCPHCQNRIALRRMVQQVRGGGKVHMSKKDRLRLRYPGGKAEQFRRANERKGRDEGGS